MNLFTFTTSRIRIAIAIAALVLLVGGYAASLVQAAPNLQINYQGKLTNASNVAVADAGYQMEFSLYTASTSGTAIWTETRTGVNEVQVQNGLFSVMLGSVTSLAGVDFNQTLYLGVTIEADSEMTPRKVLGAVPAAFEANNANTVGGVSSTSILRNDRIGSISTTSAATLFTITQNGTGDIFNIFDGGTEVFTVLDGGNVGIGSSSPSSRLTVSGNTFLGGNVTATGSLAVAGTSTLATTSVTSLSIGSLAGLLFGTNGNVSALATSSLGIALQDTTGTLAATRGGTGISTITQNQLLIGGVGNTFTQIATSSLGLSAAFTTIAQLDTLITDVTGVTGTGSFVLSASPTFTGTVIVPTQIQMGGTFFQRSGNHNLTLTTTANTLVTLPTAGTLYGNATSTITSPELANSLTDETGTGALVFASSPTFTGTALFASSTNSGRLTVLGTSTMATTTITDLTVTGAFRDALNATGTLGMVLQTTGTSTRWVATSTLGFGAGTLTGIGPAGQIQTGPTITLASSTGSFNGLTLGNTITATGNTITYTPSITGLLTNAGIATPFLSFATTSTGTDLSFSTASSTLGGTVTLNIPNSSATARGLLTASDWATFNGKISSTSLDTIAELDSLITDVTGVTGTGSFVLSTSPTFTGTALFASSTNSGRLTVLGTSTLATTTITDLALAGAFRDGTNASGTNGMVLQTTGTSTRWVATSSLGFASGATTFLALTDVPSSYTANRVLFTNSAATALTNSANFTFDGTRLTTLNLGVSGTSTFTGTSTMATTSITSLSLGSALSAINGGTGLNSYATGDLIYASGVNTLANRTIGTTGQILAVQGGIPTWVSSSTLGLVNLFTDAGTTTYLTSLTDNFAVGTTSTSSKLTVQGSAGSFDIFTVASSSGNPALRVMANSNVELTGQLIDAGVTWTFRTSPIGLYSMGYGNGRFVAMGASTLLYSDDGLSWATSTNPGADVDVNITAITYGNGLFMAARNSSGGARLICSTTGLTWSTCYSTFNATFNGVTYGNGLFVAVSDGSFYGGNRVATSPDGLNWTTRSVAGNNDAWRSVIYGNGRFVAVGDGSGGVADKVMYSTDGIIWATSTAAGDNDDWSNVTYGKGLFVAVADSGDTRVMTSPDGITWTAQTALGNDDVWTGVTYGNGLFAAVANITSNDTVMTSPDGINWTSRSIGSRWNAIAYGNGVFAAGGNNSGNELMTSGFSREKYLVNDNLYNGATSFSNLFAIGTTSRNAMLSVQGIAGTSSVLSVASSSGANFLTLNSTGNLGLGTSTPNSLLTVAGTVFVTGTSTLSTTTVTDLTLAGAFRDGANAAGTNGMVLQTTGTSTRWVATSTLGYSSLFTNSAQLAALLSDETGSAGGGLSVFSNAPTFTGTTTFTGNIDVQGGQVGVGNGVYRNDGIQLNNSAAGTFSIYGGSLANLRAGITYSANGGVVTLRDNANDFLTYNKNGQDRFYSLALEAVDFLKYTSSTTVGSSLALSTNNIPTFYINNIQNIGIGTSSPSARLTIVASSTINDVFAVASSTGSTTFKVMANGNVELTGQLIDAGVTWTARSAAGDNDQWQAVTYGNELFVAVSDSGDRVMYSSDGINWATTTAAGNNDSWKGITYGNGLFVAVASAGGDRVMTSPDGINWTARSAAGNDDAWASVTYGNGLFVAVGDSTGAGDSVITSPDGINWTTRSAAGDDDPWGDIAYGNSTFVAVATNFTGGHTVMTSPDAITWTGRSASGDNDSWQGITYGKGLFVAVGSFGERVMTSPDGVTWTGRTASGSFAAVTYGNGLFVASGVTGGVNISTSPDAINWTTRSAAGNNDFLYSITYGQGMFVALGTSGDFVITSGFVFESRLATNNLYQGPTTFMNILNIGTSTNNGTLSIQGQGGATNLLSIASSTGTNLLTMTGAGNLGLGTSTPESRLTVAGTVFVTGTSTLATTTVTDLSLAGAFRDATNSAGTNGMVLQTTGTSTRWVATSTLGFGAGASTFLALTDIPDTYNANRVFFTNGAANALTDSANFTFDGTRLATLNLGVSGTSTFTGTSTFAGNVGIGTTTPYSLLSMQKTGLTGTQTAGIDQYFGVTNSTLNAVLFGNNTYIDAAPTATSTIAGSIIKIADNTTLGNNVQGLQVQTNRGSNTLGENTAISGFGRTFGVKGTTEGDAGALFEPAGVFAETRGTTLGNAMRAYSDSITTADLVSFDQDTSAFSGNGLTMDFGTGGSFSGNFIKLRNNGTDRLTIDNLGGIFSSSTLAISGTSTLATTTATALTVAGAFRDALNATGTLGMVLQTTGTSTRWVATSTLGFGGGSSLFTDGGASTYLTSLSDNLAIGSTSAGTNKLSVAGNINIDSANAGLSILGSRVFYASSTNLSTVVGELAGANLRSVSVGNTALGYGALTTATSSLFNTAIGVDSLSSNTSGEYNTAVGASSLITNTIGISNNAFGVNSMRLNVDGSFNTAYGNGTLYENTEGSSNTAIGYNTLSANTIGSNNVGIGQDAMSLNASGTQNTAVGVSAGLNLINNQFEGRNTLVGYGTGLGITTGINNTILGANVTGLAATLANNIILADGQGNQRINVGSTGNVGIGSTSPSSKLTVAGAGFFGGNLTATGSLAISGTSTLATTTVTALTVAGALRDATNATGTLGMVLQTTGTSTRWVATSTLGFGAGTLTGIGPAGQIQSGPTITLASSTGSFNGLTLGNTITATGNTVTFLPTITGTLGNAGIATPFLSFATTSTGTDLSFSTASSTLGGTVTLNIPNSSATARGLLTASDWATFNGKISSTSLDTIAELDSLITDVTGVTGTGSFVLSTSPTFTGTALFASSTNSGRLTVLGTSTLATTTITDLALAGAFRDGTNASGTNGMVLQTTGTSTRWVATSTLGIGGTNFFTDTGAVTYLTSLTDNLAIGTTTASDKLTVNGNINLLGGTSGINWGGTRVITASTTRQNYFFGDLAGNSVTSGSSLIGIGTNALLNATSTSGNIAIGRDAGRNTTSGSDNIFIGGAFAGYENTTGVDNIFIGYAAGGQNRTGSTNVFIGNSAGNGLISGGGNAMYGSFAGSNLATSSNSVMMGIDAGFGLAGNYSASDLTILGAGAGYALQTGANNNILIGRNTANSLTTGANNLIIGYDVEAPSNTASGQLNIGNIIFGTSIDETGTTISDGNIGIGSSSPSAKLTVAGTFRATGTTTLSDLTVTGAFRDASNATGTNGMVLQSTGTSTRWVATSTLGISGGGGTFLSLSDTPSSFTANRIMYTNSGATALVDNANFTFNGTTLSAPSAVLSGTLAVAGTSSFAGVGIGTTTSSNALHIVGANVQQDFGSGDAQYILNASNNTTGRAFFSGIAGNGASERRGYMSVELNQMVVGTMSNGGSIPLHLMTNDINRVTVDVNGNVGIGSTSPSSRLTVAGNTFLGGNLTATGTLAISGTSTLATTTINGVLQMGTTSIASRFNLDVAGFNTAGTAGLNRYYTSTNAASGTQQFGELSYLRANVTATSTIVGSMFRVEDSTTLGNTIRGLEVQTNRGTNTRGENTALSGFARTFGVRGFTSADAGSVFEPAGGYFETGGTTQGNAIRGYSSTITTASLSSLFQDTSTFSGTGLQMNLGNGAGSFTGTFLDLQVAGASRFNIASTGKMFTQGDIAINTTNTDPAVNNVAGGYLGSSGYLSINRTAGTAINMGRSNDGVLAGFYSAGAIQGSISIAGATVSYNAFTGSHFGLTGSTTYPMGTVLALTGETQSYNDDATSEILYGMTESVTENNPKVVGSYLSVLEPSQAESTANPTLVMAVGNGAMWIADQGKDIAQGDYLISSDIAGHAERDEQTADVSYVIARASEDIKWSDVTTEINGVKHKKITVFFENFDRPNIVMAAIASSTYDLTELTDETPTERFLGGLVESLVAWFGNAQNGIGNMYANVFNASERICVDGECLDASDIRDLKEALQNGGSSNPPANSGGGNDDAGETGGQGGGDTGAGGDTGGDSGGGSETGDDPTPPGDQNTPPDTGGGSEPEEPAAPPQEPPTEPTP